MKQSGKVALGGVLGAIAVLCLMGTIFPYATFALPIMAGLVLLPVAIEAGRGWGWLTFAAVAVLNVLLTPSMEAKVLFVAFLGYYPLLKLSLDPLPRLLSWPLKFLIFNVTVVASYWLMMNVFALESDTFELFGVNLPLLLLALANITFLIFDLAATLLLEGYMRVLHPRLHRMLHA